MNDRRERAEAVVRKYTRLPGPFKTLGGGIEGFVFKLPRPSAVKVFEHSQMYRAELAAYDRLQQVGITNIVGLAVPQLIAWDHEFQVIEMTIVKPPFLLDFAQATLDEPIDYPEDVMADWWNRVAEMFGDRFDDAREVFHALEEEAGIYYYDLAPRNVNFGDRS